ncbi:MAG: MFS transporter [Minisyncoccota bacterium]
MEIEKEPIFVETTVRQSKKILGLRPNVFWLGIVSLFNDFSGEMVYSVMPGFLTSVFGAPPILIGFLEGFADALASFLKIYSGWLSDKIKKRKFLSVIGYSLSTATRWFLALAGNFWQVFFLRAIDRIGKGFRDSPRDALISESVEPSELGKSFGYHRAMDTMGKVLGPLSAIIILPLILNDYRLLFKIAFVLGIFAVAAFFFVKEPKKEKLESVAVIDDGIRSYNIKKIFSLSEYTKEFKLFILSIFLFGLGEMPIALTLLKSKEIGLNGFSIPLMYFVTNVAFVLFAIPAGRISDKIGERKVLVLGFLAAITAYVNLAVFKNVYFVVLGFIFLGLYSAMTDGVERALASKLVVHEKLAAGQGFLNAAIGISTLLSSLIGGGIWTVFGSAPAFVYGIFMMVIGLFSFIILNKKKQEI